MSYPLDTAAQNAALNALLSGTTTGIPTSWEFALYDGDPRITGSAELDATGGYARVVIANDATHFPGAVDGRSDSTQITLPTPTGAYSTTARFWVLYDHADSTTRWWFGPLSEEIDGTQATAAAVASVRWNLEA